MPGNSIPSVSASGRTSGGHTACLGLGSNFRPEHHLRGALEKLGEVMTVRRVSNAWQTQAMGGSGPDYLNAAVLIDSDLATPDLIAELKRIERDLGRVASDRNSIPIDIDLLLYDGEVQRSEIWDHAYCAIPVAELVPDLRSETESLGEVARRLAAEVPMRLRSEVFSTVTSSRVIND